MTEEFELHSSSWSSAVSVEGAAYIQGGAGPTGNKIATASGGSSSSTIGQLDSATYDRLGLAASTATAPSAAASPSALHRLRLHLPPPPPPPPPLAACRRHLHLPPPPQGSSDTIAFPRIAQYNSFSFGNGSTQAHFQLNVFLGCNPAVADRSYALNPKQVNLIIPTILVSPDGLAAGPNCGAAGTGFAVSYGAYASITSAIASPYPGIGTIRAWSGAACPLGDYACFMDGTRYAPESLNFASADSAEWAAKVRAHSTKRTSRPVPTPASTASGARLPLGAPTSRRGVPPVARRRSDPGRPGTTGRSRT